MNAKVLNLDPEIEHNFEESLLTPEDVQRILNITETQFRKLVFSKAFRKSKVGGLLRFEPEEIRQYRKKILSAS